jgi:asparagine synthase (glutamine-hydrolysing)
MGVYSDLVVVLDARLDNLKELWGNGSDMSPCAAIAEMWRRSGSDMIDRLVGDVAGIVIDRRTQLLFGFRDLCGGRPLYVRAEREWCAAASGFRRLAFHRGMPRPSRRWFASAFLGYSIDPVASPYDGVDAVLPGHVATQAVGGWEQTRRATWHVPVLRRNRSDELADCFRELFDEAVRCRVGGEPVVGVCLSGGLDSTSVMATLADVRPDTRRIALSMGMREPAGDERQLQTLVAARAGAELRWIDFEDAGPLGSNGPEELFARFGAPPLVINWFFGDAMARAAEQEHVAIVLDGEDGDGSLGGSPAYFADLLATGRWGRWWSEAASLANQDVVGRKALLQHSLLLLAPPGIRRMLMRRAEPNVTSVLLSPFLVRELGLESRAEGPSRLPAWAPGRTFRRAQGIVGEPEQIGPVFAAISQPWRPRGVSLSHPFSDRRVMSFCMGLPFEEVCSQGQTKLILRRAMAERLPGDIVNRRGKASLAEAARRRAFGPERPYVIEGFRLARRHPEWFNAEAVDEVAAGFKTGTDEVASLRLAMFAWWLDWCERGGSSDLLASARILAT